MELADVARDIVVWLETERNDWHKAEGEPFPCGCINRAPIKVELANDLPSLKHLCREVSAVLTLYCNIFVFFEERAEGVRTTCEEESHDETVDNYATALSSRSMTRMTR